ncbi:MAG: IPT/TIG domain-containing protein [Chloroflexota bacterium]
MNRRGRASASLVCAILAAGVWGAGGAGATTITVGSPLVGSFNVAVAFTEQGTVANTTLADPSANVTSPVDGMVVRWRMTGFSTAGPYKLRILRPAGEGRYTGAGTSSPETRLGTGTETFTTRLPIQAGDLIGLDGAGASSSFPVASNAGSSFSIWRPPLQDGWTAAPQPGSAHELGFDAAVQPAPQVILISPASGPVSGGTSVTISGHDFTEVTAVSFGSTPAASFVVNSEDSITAVSPPSAARGAVDVTVAAAGGSSPHVAADRFTYLAICTVPKLKRTTLKRARKRLRRAHCRLGKVSGTRRRSARVTKQRPKPGAKLPAGGKVSVKLR